jgi:hypothetical protein
VRFFKSFGAEELLKTALFWVRQNLKYFGRRQRSDLDEKGKSSEEIQMAVFVLALTDWAMDLKMGRFWLRFRESFELGMDRSAKGLESSQIWQ